MTIYNMITDYNKEGFNTKPIKGEIIKIISNNECEEIVNKSPDEVNNIIKETLPIKMSFSKIECLGNRLVFLTKDISEKGNESVFISPTIRSVKNELNDGFIITVEGGKKYRFFLVK